MKTTFTYGLRKFTLRLLMIFQFYVLFAFMLLYIIKMNYIFNTIAQLGVACIHLIVENETETQGNVFTYFILEIMERNCRI